jgi:hypothetical protein
MVESRDELLMEIAR